MTQEERAVMQQALEALEEAYENGFLTGIAGLKTIDILTVMREACANVCVEYSNKCVDVENWEAEDVSLHCAAAVRASGEK